MSPEHARPQLALLETRWFAAIAALAVFGVALGLSASVVRQWNGPDLDEFRTRLLQEAADVIQVRWTNLVEDYAAVTGDVVWSETEDEGYLLLRGLPVNRPEVQQYQLWIVDPARDKHPIDGGVFDIPTGAEEVIIPIDPKLQVVKATTFAITLEKPGGVVVSDGPLLLAASAP